MRRITLYRPAPVTTWEAENGYRFSISHYKSGLYPTIEARQAALAKRFTPESIGPATDIGWVEAFTLKPSPAKSAAEFPPAGRKPARKRAAKRQAVQNAA